MQIRDGKQGFGEVPDDPPMLPDLEIFQLLACVFPRENFGKSLGD